MTLSWKKKRAYNIFIFKRREYVKKIGAFLITLLLSTTSMPCAAKTLAMKQYGANGDIKVYQNGDHCLITILGRNHHHLPQSLAFWSESMSHTLLVFANTTRFDIALQLLHNAGLKKENMALSQNTLTLNNTTVPIHHIATSGVTTPIYLLTSPRALSADFVNNTFFIGNFDKGRKRPEQVKFDLQGFKEALREAETVCHGRDTPLASRVTFKFT